MVEAGINYRLTRAQPAPANEIPAIRLAYRRPVAVPPSCDKWGENVGRNEERIPYPNLGCATQHNLAIMIDNARDMQRPQKEDPRAGERRNVTWSASLSPRSIRCSCGATSACRNPPVVDGGSLPGAMRRRISARR
ncbi:MAG: hypothetical protein HC869_06545 [Rhodospirillales bacterium]|nr:hypothetical protein [Rhodospirillales bacterium]